MMCNPKGVFLKGTNLNLDVNLITNCLSILRKVNRMVINIDAAWIRSFKTTAPMAVMHGRDCLLARRLY